MMKSMICLTLVSMAQPAFGLGLDEIFDGLDRLDSAVNATITGAAKDIAGFGDYALGEVDKELKARIDGLYAGSYNWKKNMYSQYEKDSRSTTAFVEAAVASWKLPSSDPLRMLKSIVTGDMFSSGDRMPVQYAYFLKDKKINRTAFVNEVFGNPTALLESIPADVAESFKQCRGPTKKIDGSSYCSEEMFGNVLDIPAFATAYKNAGVDVSLWKATAQIGDLFQLSKKNTKYSGIDFDYDLRGLASIQKAVVAMNTTARQTFAAAMAATKDGAAIELGAAWAAVLAQPELASELNTNGVDVAKLTAAASSASSGAVSAETAETDDAAAKAAAADLAKKQKALETAEANLAAADCDRRSRRFTRVRRADAKACVAKCGCTVITASVSDNLIKTSCQNACLGTGSDVLANQKVLTAHVLACATKTSGGTTTKKTNTGTNTGGTSAYACKQLRDAVRTAQGALDGTSGATAITAGAAAVAATVAALLM